MKLTALDHITINCTDYPASQKFYGELLGLAWQEDVDLGDHVLHYYALPAGRLELITYKEPQKSWQTGNTDTGIYRHMALCVDDLDALYEKVKQEYRINLPPSFIEGIGKRVMLVADPNGVELEFIQA